MRTGAPVALPGPKRQGLAQSKTAGANSPDFRVREASWTAVGRHRFSPKTCLLNLFQKTNRHMIYGNALNSKGLK
jgi:hypothetical protein